MLVGYVGCDSAARLARRGHDLLACSVARGTRSVAPIATAEDAFDGRGSGPPVRPCIARARSASGAQ
jgi:hypothetical protein